MAEFTAIDVRLHQGPIPPAPQQPEGARDGAVLEFLGVVRDTEQGRPLCALRYEIYEPMTTRELRALAEQAARDHALTRITVEHSVGDVSPGAASFRLRVSAERRVAAFEAASLFIDRMKMHVPIWKVPIWRDAP